ncbi:MAG: polysaccharide pyruvyl transferase family protein [Allorhizobium sp.]
MAATIFRRMRRELLKRRAARAAYVFVHSVTNNIGDLKACPKAYFGDDFPSGSVFPCRHLVELLREEGHEAGLRLFAGKTIIFGGGGLISFDKHSIHAEVLLFLKCFADGGGVVVIWGAGHNKTQGFREWYNDAAMERYPAFLSKFALVGLRDFHGPHRWVPCVSCMDPAFGEERSPRHNVVAFLHGQEDASRMADFEGVPTLVNIKRGTKRNVEAQFRKVVDFISSGSCVVTNSYHGLYWATLLGRPVIAMANSSKFLSHKYSFVEVNDLANWRQKLDVAMDRVGHMPYPALVECRQANIAFRDAVVQLAKS